MPTIDRTANATQFDDLVPPVAMEATIQRVHICECCGKPAILIPRLKCVQCNAELAIKCRVYKRRGKFYAECLTLDLLSESETETDAIRRLHVAMFSYVATVTQPGASATGLIPRSAPFSSWLRYYVDQAIDRLGYLFTQKPSAVQTFSAGEALTLVHCS